MESFLEILQKARKGKSEDVQKSVAIEQEVVQESVEPKKVDKNEELQHIYLGDAIVLTSQQAMLKTKKLRAINSARRLAKKLCSNEISTKDLEKCFKMQERFPKPQNLNYQLVGGDALNRLRKMLAAGIKLNDALNTKIER